MTSTVTAGTSKVVDNPEMTSRAGHNGRVIAVSLAPGTQLTDAIEQACRDHGVETAVILSVIGTISEVYLRNPRDITTLPIRQEHEFADEIDTVVLQRPMEILSVQGNVCRLDGELWAHCHALFSEAGGNVRGGHVFRATIWSQGEVFLQELADIRIDREHDEDVTGLPQIQLHGCDAHPRDAHPRDARHSDAGPADGR
ncbi:DNA-binding protein [Solwaraspora sp. WMMD406]|uniref:PPC domain-containing DNA-binding protein n=1 Tax=Solwaraspora sp. WMMD406 TaxID=3016095 RepID=UPI002416D7A7|nr:PPC domain-containing DNA-binding protein [Solwaraspora sp. WMMD406]MDG4762770.1 DNA-binding protein [Solwaraspora sp. WMMD406]